MAAQLDGATGSLQRRTSELLLLRELCEGDPSNSDGRIYYDLYGSLQHRLHEYVIEKGGLKKTPIIAEYADILHYDILSDKVDKLLGRFERRAFNPRVIDLSINARNKFKEDFVNAGKDRVKRLIVAPIHQAIETEVLKQYQVEDYFSLSKEDKMDLDSSIEAALAKALPKGFKARLEEDVPAPEAENLQRMMDIIIKEYSIEAKLQQAVELFVQSGFVCMFSGMKKSSYDTSICMPEDITFDSSHKSRDLHNGTWFRHAESVPVQKIVREHLLSAAELENILSNQSDDGENVVVLATKNLLLSEDYPMVRNIKFDLTSREGTQQYVNFISRYYGSTSNSAVNQMVDRIHYVFSGLRFIKRIHRLNRKTGLVEKDWQHEYYYLDPAKGDVKEEMFVVPRWYQATRVKNEWLDLGPVKYQYQGPDPFMNMPSYLGTRWKPARIGELRPKSPVDRVINLLYSYNVEKHLMNSLKSRSIGPVLIVPDSGAGDGSSVSEELMSAKYEGVIRVPLVDENGQPNPAAQYLYKVQDFSSATAMVQYEASCQRIENEVARRLGTDSMSTDRPQYESAEQTRNVIESGELQVSGIIRHLDLFAETYINSCMNTVRKHIKHMRDIGRFGLDDLDASFLELDIDGILRANPFVKVSTNPRDEGNFNVLRNNFIGFLNSKDAGIAGYGDLFAVLTARSIPELSRLGLKMDQKRKEYQQLQSEARAAEIETDFKYKERLLRLNNDMKALIEEARLKTNLLMAKINAERYENMMDVDKNATADANQREAMRIASQEELERLRLKAKKDLQEAKIALERFKTIQNNKTKVRVAGKKSVKNT